MTTSPRTVGATARLLGVTTRTLHHWDAIGLVCPSERSPGGYRLYSAAEVARAHRVLVYRELGVPLDDIADLLDATTADAVTTLRAQRAELEARMRRLRGMAEAVDRLIDARESGVRLSAEDQVAIFGDGWEPAWVEQARERWGETPQWAQYAERVADRTPQDWRAITDALTALHDDLAEALRRGVAPGSPEADSLAERHRASLATYFDCTHAMHVCLARRYVGDPGFTAFYEDIEPGLTRWLRAVIDANARANGVDPEHATWC
nr:MerR family transcriptional regulator [Nocardia caishijiensis]